MATPTVSSLLPGRDDLSLLDVVQLGEILIQIGITRTPDLILIRSLAVALVQALHYAHAFDYRAKRREALAVQRLVAAKIDEQLRGARIRASGGECKRSGPVGLQHRVVRKVLVPLPGHRRIARHAELHDELRHHAEEAVVIVVSVPDQFIETLRALGRPRLMDLYH